MKNKNSRNYFSKVMLLSIVSIWFLGFTHGVKAQLLENYGGKQIMYWGPEICDNSSTNVHFILGTEMFYTLYDSPATITYGDSDVEFGVSQVGTYEPIPVTCIANIAGVPVPIMITDGTYYDATTGESMKDKFFAGAVNPFIKRVDIKA